MMKCVVNTKNEMCGNHKGWNVRYLQMMKYMISCRLKDENNCMYTLEPPDKPELCPVKKSLGNIETGGTDFFRVHL